jgi:tRNA A-37 threonylcarbamoyl transferase component Bud32
MDNLVGKNLGRYHVIEPLGQGGMASVYKGFDNSLERNVAIKIIRADKKEGTEQDAFLKRFQREARALAQLDHPYILKVLDYGEQEGTPYLIMPFVPGGTLKARMGHPIPYREAAVLLAPIAQALDYAHHRKIIHRDVKPANILIGESNTPLLSDFGIAKILESEEATQLTATGIGIGTPDYMAPEQWLGKVDARTDIYSLGIVFFQMVTGHLPFSADTPAAVLLKHMHDPLPRPTSFVPDLPEAVEHVLYKALAKESESRFQDMGAFAEALEKLARGDTTNLAAVSQEMETIRADVAGATVLSPLEKVRAPAVVRPAKKGSAGWKVGLIVVAGVAVLILALVLLTGGVYLASRMSSRSKATTTLSANLQSTQASSTLPPPLALAPDQTQVASPDGASYKSTPFLSIEGFPADIPILKDNNGNLMKSTTQGATIYQFTTNLPFQQVVDFYKSGMNSNGWTVMNETTQADMYYWVFSKGDKRQVMISLSLQAKGIVTISIILQ